MLEMRSFVQHILRIGLMEAFVGSVGRFVRTVNFRNIGGIRHGPSASLRVEIVASLVVVADFVVRRESLLSILIGEMIGHFLAMRDAESAASAKDEKDNERNE